MSYDVKNPLEKDEHKTAFAVWCDTCNRIYCMTRRAYNSRWEEQRDFEEATL